MRVVCDVSAVRTAVVTARQRGRQDRVGAVRRTSASLLLLLLLLLLLPAASSVPLGVAFPSRSTPPCANLPLSASRPATGTGGFLLRQEKSNLQHYVRHYFFCQAEEA
jgi:hypothetical protein